jgi:hypothetical protein
MGTDLIIIPDFNLNVLFGFVALIFVGKLPRRLEIPLWIQIAVHVLHQNMGYGPDGIGG